MDDDRSINRRTFVTEAIAVVACAGLASCAGLGGATPVFTRGPVDVGTAANYPVNGAYDIFAKTHGFFILRQQGRIVAASVICTHRRCVVEIEKAELVCPCHGSRFNGAGLPVEGPASRPLPRFAISRDAQSRLIVDSSREFTENQWTDPAAFVMAGI